MILNANPKKENLNLKKKIIRDIENVIDSGYYILGKKVNKFEKKFSKYINCKYSVAVNSGFDALLISLKILSLRKNDEVIVPSLSASATAVAVANTNAKLIYADINIKNYNISLDDVINKITKKTKAIIVVHLHGQPCNILELKKKINNPKIKIIEDCAQAHGAKISDKLTGAMGDLGCFSFYPTKNLGCIGDGGLITTSNYKYYLMAKQIRQYGWKTRDNSEVIGINSRLDELQASILLLKLKDLDKKNNERRQIAKHYLKYINKSNNLILPELYKSDKHVFHHFVVRLHNINREKLIKYFEQKGLQILIHYPKPLYKQKAIKGKISNLKNTEIACKSVISLPIYPGLSIKKIKIISTELNSYVKKNRPNN
jgi:dTDP-4-amino-4,6-dideoxygalactose transaminase